MQAKIKELLEKQGYRIIGNHSAIKVCHWTKEKLVNNRSCYKSKFYGISSHRCLQVTPSVLWCEHQCLFCWRPMEFMDHPQLTISDYNEPKTIVEESLVYQRQLLSGFWGNSHVKTKDMEAASNPKHAAISLSGEPTAYPFIDELIAEYNRRGFTTFLVTNGQNPRALEKCNPTQTYISLVASNQKLYDKMNVPLYKDGWDRLNQSLEVMNEKKGRRVLRITLIKGFNLESPKKFANLILKANPDYIEPKGYVHVGHSRKRLEREDMPTYDEVMEFGQELADEINYKLTNSSRASKVALLSRDC
jgi:tRNA wybutosine-synthesizing protein 1